MSLKFGMLGLLNYGPSTGYEINTFFKDSLAFFWEAQTSQIYRQLTALEREGLACSEVIMQRGKPNKNLFRITQQGREAFYDWMGTPFTDDSFQFKSPLLMKLFFAAGQDKAITLAMLDQFIADMRDALAQMPAVSRHIDVALQEHPFAAPDGLYWSLTADFGYRYYEMAIAWAEHARQEIAK